MGMVRRQGLGLLGAANIWSTSLSACRTLSLSRAIFSSAGVRRLSAAQGRAGMALGQVVGGAKLLLFRCKGK